MGQAKFSQEWLNAYNARQGKSVMGNPITGKKGVEDETKLHDQIFDECRRRGWIALHGAMSERTHRTLGEPDFTILADRGRVYFIECKSRTGKRSPDQQALHAWASKLGHPVHTIRTLEEFLAIIKA